MFESKNHAFPKLKRQEKLKLFAAHRAAEKRVLRRRLDF